MISLSLWMEKLIDFCQVLYGIFCGDNWLIIGLDLVGSSELFFRIFFLYQDAPRCTLYGDRVHDSYEEQEF